MKIISVCPCQILHLLPCLPELHQEPRLLPSLHSVQEPMASFSEMMEEPRLPAFLPFSDTHSALAEASLSTPFTPHGSQRLPGGVQEASRLSTPFTLPGFKLSTLFTPHGFRELTVFALQACLFYTLFLYNPRHCHNATGPKKPASASVGRLRISQRRSQT